MGGDLRPARGHFPYNAAGSSQNSRIPMKQLNSFLPQVLELGLVRGVTEEITEALLPAILNSD